LIRRKRRRFARRRKAAGRDTRRNRWTAGNEWPSRRLWEFSGAAGLSRWRRRRRRGNRTRLHVRPWPQALKLFFQRVDLVLIILDHAA
jgi:hypothetical protein